MIRRQMNSMVRLKNIKKSDGTIECDIYPEDSTLPGHVVVSIKTEEIIKFTTKYFNLLKEVENDNNT